MSLHALGSCLAAFGRTQVLCAASLEDRPPHWMRKTGLGWVSAEYGMLPHATHERMRREAKSVHGQGGRTHEIQRLIGRSLRICVDRATLGERMIVVDCDVLQADGGTRTAAISGGYVALRLAVDRLLARKKIRNDPMVDQVAAVSCGIRGGEPILDLDYAEDSNAEVDANFVLTRSGRLVEVQATAESRAFADSQLHDMLALAQAGCAEIAAKQDAAIASARPG